MDVSKSQQEVLTEELTQWLGEKSIKLPEVMSPPECQTTRWARLEIPFGKFPEAKVIGDKGDFEEIDLLGGLIPTKTHESSAFPLVSPKGKKLELKSIVEGEPTDAEHSRLSLDGKELGTRFEDCYTVVKDTLYLHQLAQDGRARVYSCPLTDLDKDDFGLALCKVVETSAGSLRVFFEETESGKLWYFSDQCLICDGVKIAEFGSNLNTKYHQKLQLYKDLVIVCSIDTIYKSEELILDLHSKKFCEATFFSQDFLGYFTIPEFGTIFAQRNSPNWFLFWLIRDGCFSESVSVLIPEIKLDFFKPTTLHVKRDFTVVIRTSVWSLEDDNVADLNRLIPDLNLKLNKPEIKEELTQALTDWVGKVTWPEQIPLPESYETGWAKLEVPFGKNPVATISSRWCHFEEIDPLEGATELPETNIKIYGDYAVSNELIVDIKKKIVVASNKDVGCNKIVGFLRIPEFGTVYIKNCYSNSYKCFLIKDGASSESVMFQVPHSFMLKFNDDPKLSFKTDFTIVVQTQVQKPEEYRADSESYMDYWNNH